MLEQELIQKLEALYQEKRESAKNRAQAHTAEAERRIPELKTVDRALSEIGLRVLGESLKGGADLEERVHRLEEENRALQRLQGDLLEKAGYPRDYMKLRYECPRCSDTGFLGTAMCDCMKKALVAERIRASGLEKLLERQNFHTFRLDAISDLPLEGKSYSARAAMQKILERCRRYADTFGEDSPSLLFIGGTGLGKTHLSSAIAKAVLEKGFDVVYDSVPNVIGIFEKERFLPAEEAVRTRRIQEADLLILDDLGTEPQSKTAASEIYNLINSRTLVACRPTIISTNLSYRQLEKQYDAPITSRLFGEFEVLLFQGADMRRARL